MLLNSRLSFPTSTSVKNRQVNVKAKDKLPLSKGLEMSMLRFSSKSDEVR